MSQITSPSDICNLALVQLGTARISSLNDNTPTAGACNDVYDHCRRTALQEHFWSFATRRSELNRLAETPQSKYGYYYQLPDQFLRAVKAEHDYLAPSQVKYKLEAGKLATDETEFHLVYIADEDDVEMFDPLFVEALSNLIAYKLCNRLTDKDESKYWSLYKIALSKARTVDSQDSNEEEEMSEWERARWDA